MRPFRLQNEAISSIESSAGTAVAGSTGALGCPTPASAGAVEATGVEEVSFCGLPGVEALLGFVVIVRQKLLEAI